jgi:MoxR-like ATPase
MGLKHLEPMLEFGASPRATIFLGKGARAVAFLAGRGYVTPQDVKDIAFNVLRHRVVLTYEAEAEERTSEDIIARILETVPVHDEVARGTLRSILEQAGIDLEAFLDLL